MVNLKRIVGLLITVAFIIGNLNGVFASDYEGDTVRDFTVSVDGVYMRFRVLTKSGTSGTVQIERNGYDAIPDTTSGEFNIPEEVEYDGVTYTVTSIGSYAFSLYHSLTNITIPNSVTHIESWAFFDCIGLKSVTIPESVSSMGDFIFGGCINLETIYLVGDCPALTAETFALDKVSSHSLPFVVIAYVLPDAAGFPSDGEFFPDSNVVVKRLGSNIITGNIASTYTHYVIGRLVNAYARVVNLSGSTINNVKINAVLPPGITLASGTLSKTVPEIAIGENESIIFSFYIPPDYEGDTIVITGNYTIDETSYTFNDYVVNVGGHCTIYGPRIAYKNTAFKLYGDVIQGGSVEIVNADTGEVIVPAQTVNSQIYFIEVANGIGNTTRLKAVVNGIWESEIMEIEAQDAPLLIEESHILYGGVIYKDNRLIGVPTFSVWTDANGMGSNLGIQAKFNKEPVGDVKFTFGDKTVTAKKAGDYFTGDIAGWRGSGRLDVIVTAEGKVTILFDPSGYITDEDTGGPVEGVKVTLEQKYGSNWITWDADTHLQQNPLYSDEDGYYGWDVPVGVYRIKAQKEGYESKIIESYIQSDGFESDISVLPVRMDVDFSMKKLPTGVQDNALNALLIEEFTITGNNCNIARLAVLNPFGTIISGSVIVAVYEDNRLVEAKTFTMAFEAAKTTFVDNIELETHIAPSHTVKAFIWQDLTKMTPLI